MLGGDDARLYGEKLPDEFGSIVHEPSVGFKFIGESINEDQTVSGGEESAGLSIEGHYEKKARIIAGWIAA